MHYIGIDSAKATFEAALPQAKGFQVVKLGNTEEGFTKLLAQLPADCHCVMEATGPYYCRLATFLYQNQIRVSVVNPLVIKRFSQMRMIKAKTDKAGAAPPTRCSLPSMHRWKSQRFGNHQPNCCRKRPRR